MICGAGSLSGDSIRVSTSSPHAARAVYRIARQIFASVPALQTRKSRLTAETIWTLNLPPTSPGASVAKLCCAKSFLRGAFLTGGYVAPPDRDYHGELLCRETRYLPRLKQVLARVGIKVGELTRGGRKVIYTKDAEHIARLLNLIGAHTALMEFENRRALRQLKSQVNRAVNMDTANAEKTVSAAERQIEDINTIDREMGLYRLSPNLQTVARLRLAYPEASLSELASLATPPLTKSAVNHRLRKIHAVARGLKYKHAYDPRCQKQ